MVVLALFLVRDFGRSRYHVGAMHDLSVCQPWFVMFACGVARRGVGRSGCPKFIRPEGYPPVLRADPSTWQT